MDAGGVDKYGKNDLVFTIFSAKVPMTTTKKLACTQLQICEGARKFGAVARRQYFILL